MNRITMNSVFHAASLTLLLLIISSCSDSVEKEQSFEVFYKGALKNIMHKGDLSTQADLASFEDEEYFYALGAMENLKGEIQIFNSKPYHSFVAADQLNFDTSYARKATLLVYSTVKDWISLPIPETVISKSDLEDYLEKVADENHIDVDQPFPFLLEGVVGTLSWHVINWKDGDTDHSHEKHMSSGINETTENVDVELLGFYSNSHHAIFTHHTTNMHIHMKSSDGKIAGHVDDLRLGKNMILKLPKNE